MKSKIIQYLKNNSEQFTSGEDISRKLKISRSGIWKYMEELRKDGYVISAAPHRGYQLKSSPDKMFPDEIMAGLNTKVIGKTILHYESIDSTMKEAFNAGMERLPEGTVICAEQQTQGKGRLGRSWFSPKGKGIYMSVLLRPDLAPVDVAKLTLLSAVAVVEPLRMLSGLDIRIKWPNDLICKNKKVVGILTEMHAEMDRVKFVVVGIGINVNTTMRFLPEGAGSLKSLTGQKYSRIQIMRNVLESLERWYDIMRSEGFIPITQRWKELSSTLGRKVVIYQPQGALEGEAIDLDPFGGLMIRNQDGVVVRRMTGDVVEVHS